MVDGRRARRDRLIAASPFCGHSRQHDRGVRLRPDLEAAILLPHCRAQNDQLRICEFDGQEFDPSRRIGVWLSSPPLTRAPDRGRAFRRRVSRPADGHTHALTRSCLSGMRRPQHWDERTPSCDSAMSSRLPSSDGPPMLTSRRFTCADRDQKSHQLQAPKLWERSRVVAEQRY